MTNAKPSAFQIGSALVAVYLIWGSIYLGIRFAVETIPPFLIAGTRSLIAGAVIFAWRRVSGDVAPTPREWHSAIIVGILLLVLSNGCVV
jgi:drug/metabolite transporter (DMT)-like permease